MGVYRSFTSWLAAQAPGNLLYGTDPETGLGIWSGSDLCRYPLARASPIADLAHDYTQHRGEIHTMRDLRLYAFRRHRRAPAALYRALAEFQEHTRPLYADKPRKPLAPYKAWLRAARRDWEASLRARANSSPAESDYLARLLQWRGSDCGKGVIMPRSHWEWIQAHRTAA